MSASGWSHGQRSTINLVNGPQVVVESLLVSYTHLENLTIPGGPQRWVLILPSNATIDMTNYGSRVRLADGIFLPLFLTAFFWLVWFTLWSGGCRLDRGTGRWSPSRWAKTGIARSQLACRSQVEDQAEAESDKV